MEMGRKKLQTCQNGVLEREKVTRNTQQIEEFKNQDTYNILGGALVRKEKWAVCVRVYVRER